MNLSLTSSDLQKWLCERMRFEIRLKNRQEKTATDWYWISLSQWLSRVSGGRTTGRILWHFYHGSSSQQPSHFIQVNSVLRNSLLPQSNVTWKIIMKIKWTIAALRHFDIAIILYVINCKIDKVFLLMYQLTLYRGVKCSLKTL